MKKFGLALLGLASIVGTATAFKKPLDIQYTLNKTCTMGNRTEKGDVLVMHYDIVNPANKKIIASTRKFDFPKELRPLGGGHNMAVLDQCSWGMCVGDKRRCVAEKELWARLFAKKYLKKDVHTLFFDIEIIDILHPTDKSPKDFICKRGECFVWTPAEALWQVNEWKRLRKIYDQTKKEVADHKLLKAKTMSSLSHLSSALEMQRTRVPETAVKFDAMPTSVINGIE